MDQEIILILDDYHVIENQAIAETLCFFLDALPASMHLALLSRTVPALPLARLRVRGQILEIGFSDLCFTREEAMSFLVQHMGLPLTAEEVTLLTARTEGWIAGLQLTGLALRKQQDFSRAVSPFTGTPVLCETTCSRRFSRNSRPRSRTFSSRPRFYRA